MTENVQALNGGCHCGAIRFRAFVAPPLNILRCNCSICRMQGFEHIIIDDENFEMLRGANELSEYTFNTGIAKHWFCSRCGIKSFYKPRSHPDGVSINARCVDSLEGVPHAYTDFDGSNWEENVGDIRA